MYIKYNPARVAWQTLHHCRLYILEPELRLGHVKVWCFLRGECEWHPPGSIADATRWQQEPFLRTNKKNSWDFRLYFNVYNSSFIILVGG